MGYDVHRLVEGRRLIIGGVEIPYRLGLDGHSDADVLVHSLCDALLGAVGEGDLGVHFPDSDERYRGISSLKLLERVSHLVREKGYQIANVDCTIVAQAPRMGPHAPAMRKTIAGVLQVQPEHINIKATSTEGLGFTGRGEGIAAYTITLLMERQGTAD